MAQQRLETHSCQQRSLLATQCTHVLHNCLPYWLLSFVGDASVGRFVQFSPLCVAEIEFPFNYCTHRYGCRLLWRICMAVPHSNSSIKVHFTRVHLAATLFRRVPKDRMKELVPSEAVLKRLQVDAGSKEQQPHSEPHPRSFISVTPMI